MSGRSERTASLPEPVDIEDDGDGNKGAVFDVPFVGKVTVWPGVIEVQLLNFTGGVWDATPDQVVDAGRHLLAAAEWMRKEQQ
jgi:hypothetical protein